MIYRVNVSYEEQYTVEVEASTPQEAEEKILLQLEANSISDHEDRSTNNREYEAYVELR